MTYNLPDKPGVYLLTGANGTGKTTLLVALNRLGDKLSFKEHFYSDEHKSSASIAYNIGKDVVTYRKRNQRWSPRPKSRSKLLEEYKYHHTYYLTATGLRLYQQEKLNLSRNDHHQTSEDIKNALNNIFNTDKFNNLEYIKVSPKKGRQKILHRKNKLYVLKNSYNKQYSELSFSLGERMALNALDFIEGIQQGGMLLIDEVELALHPLAQVRFYNYLEGIAKSKDLVVIVSTHSTSLIKSGKNLHYLENKDGNIQVLYDVKPAYVLKDLSVESDNCPDYIFFVEDEMARVYLTEVLKSLRSMDLVSCSPYVKILPVGGYRQVLELMKHFYGLPPFSRKNVHSFLDEDVKTTYNNILHKNSKNQADLEFIRLMQENSENYNYLSITPELGVWNELTLNSDWFQEALNKEYTDIFFNVENIVSMVNSEEISENSRKRAKGCFKNMLDKLHEKKKELHKNDFNRLLFQSYVKHKIDSDRDYLGELRKKITPILNRK